VEEEETEEELEEGREAKIRENRRGSKKKETNGEIRALEEKGAKDKGEETELLFFYVVCMGDDLGTERDKGSNKK
jgi:hypothetical protein